MTKIRVLYMGTPDFAVPALKMLAQRNDVEVIGTVTQADKPKGRGYKLLPPPVKEAAAALNIPVFQPATLKDEAFADLLNDLNPDLIVVAAYGKILPPNVIRYPKYGCMNIHASLLPKYRGAAPIHWCLIHGEEKTGVTIMQMDDGLDTGDMLLKKEYSIQDTDTTGILFDKMAILGAEAMSAVLDNLDHLQPQKQDESLTCYSPMIAKSMCGIDFNKTAAEISNLVRGLNPFPGAKCYRQDGKMLKILFSKPTDATTAEAPGTVIEGKNAILVAAGNGTVLEILKLQPEGGKAMETTEFLRGRNLEKGEVLVQNKE